MAQVIRRFICLRTGWARAWLIFYRPLQFTNFVKKQKDNNKKENIGAEEQKALSQN